MKANEQDDIAAATRAGGDVIWKSASEGPPAESTDEKLSTASPEAPEGDTRGCGIDGITKSASQKQTGDS